MHPNRKMDGTFEDEFSFPFGGSFKLFVLVTPKWERPQRFPLEMIIKGDERKGRPLIPKKLTHSEGYDYTLHIEPNPVAHSDLNLVVTIMKNQKPVALVQSASGPSGHCIILSEKAERFVHAHPIAAQDAPQTQPNVRLPPNELRFNTQFPSPGRYKIWIQFKTAPEKVHTADFVVDIK